MSEELVRLARLEVGIDVHAREIKELKEQSKNTQEALDGIRDNLQAIKYLVLGFVIWGVAQEVGLFNAIAKLF